MVKAAENWKTTAMGLLTIIGAVVMAARALLDGDDATNVNIEATLAAITLGIGMIMGSDAK